MARVLGELPKSLIIYGIEGEQFGIGKDISKHVQISADKVTGMLLKDIQKILTGNPTYA